MPPCNILYIHGLKYTSRLNVVQGFLTLPNLAMVRVCIFAGTQEEILKSSPQIETLG